MNAINNAGLALIKTFEGLKLKAYRDIAGRWTIGYGHTGNVLEGQEITQEQADAYLRQDAETARQTVLRLVTVPLNDNQIAALCSFVYNLGQGTFASSTMRKDLNAGRIAEASNEFVKWSHSNGVIVPGLLRRREMERDLFNDFGIKE